MESGNPPPQGPSNNNGASPSEYQGKKANLADPSTNNSAVEEATSQASDANIHSCQDLMYSTDIIQEMVELASKLNPNGTFDQKGSEIVEGQTSKWVSEESSEVPLPHPKSSITALDSAAMEAMFDSNSSVINDQLEATQLVTYTRANQVGTPVAKLLPNHVESFTLSPDTLLPMVNTIGTDEIVGDAVGMSPSGVNPKVDGSATTIDTILAS